MINIKLNLQKFCLTALALVALSITACTKKSQVDYNLNIDETLRWVISTEPPTLDWHLGTDTTSARVVDTLMDGLVRYDFNSNEVKNAPGLASSWEASKDMKTWTFTLRDNVKWHDGVTFTAQHVLDGWERILNPKTGAEYASFLFNVKNAKAYFDGKVKNFGEVGAKINDKGQIVVELDTPQSYFPTILAHHSTFPIRKDRIEKFGAKWTEANNFVGLGAFKLKIWDHDKALVLERNDDYYGAKAKIKYILGRIVNEHSTALNMFKKGEVDAIDEIPTVELESAKKMPEYVKSPLLAFNYFGFNVKASPTDNVKVRRALNMAIDRDEVNRVLMGDKTPAYNILPPGLVGHNPAIGDKFNVKLANQLLDEAGYKDRSKLPKIQLNFNTNENIQRIAENVQAQFKKNLGIQIELLNEEWKTYLKTLQARNFKIFRMAWVADYPDADTFMGLFTTDSGNNRTQWGNKRYDELIKKAVAELDNKKRADYYAEAQKILNEEEVPVIPLYYSTNQFLVNKRIKNYPINSMHKFYANDVEIIK